MMDYTLDQNWREAFALAAAVKAAERQDERMSIFYDDIDREKDKSHKKAERDAEESKKLEEALATTAQVAEFTTHLDAYDEKTVEALMENRQALDKVRDELLHMTKDAYVLPDGRRAFKTADGRQVFDEHGLEVSLKTIDPDAIGDHHPRWETFKAAKEAESKLVSDQSALIQFQAKVDDARERASKGDVSKRQLDDLDADLKAALPGSVRQKLGFAKEAGDELRMRRDRDTPVDLPSLTDDLSRRLQAAPVPR